MTIEYLIALEDGTTVVSGTFDAEDPAQRARFARRAMQAWEDGHAVITRKVVR